MGKGVEALAKGAGKAFDKVIDGAGKLIDKGGDALAKLTTPIIIAAACVGGAMLIVGILVQMNKRKEQTENMDPLHFFRKSTWTKNSDKTSQNNVHDESEQHDSLNQTNHEPKIFVISRATMGRWTTINKGSIAFFAFNVIIIVLGCTLITLHHYAIITITTNTETTSVLASLWAVIICLNTLLCYDLLHFPTKTMDEDEDAISVIITKVDTTEGTNKIVHQNLCHIMEAIMLGILLIGPVAITILQATDVWNPYEKDELLFLDIDKTVLHGA